jgi:DNA-binding MarR family transcriptional regulator
MILQGIYHHAMAPSRSPHRIAFLLAQVGADAAAAFDTAVRELGITPSEAGLLRLVGRRPGISQRVVSQQMGIGPSRVVAVLDRLESDELVQRRRSIEDRRNHEITVTAKGQDLLARLRTVAERHEQAFVAALSPDQIQLLGETLTVIAETRELSRELHRGTSDR